MTVNFETKGILAKLLATENILVEHKRVDTASFNVETRVLTLPLFENASNDVYDTLIHHESAHAIWSPNIDWTLDYDISPSIVNVVEDARIEKLCKRKYPGSPKTFYRGYKELYEANFFCIEGQNISKMNLADRANLYFKIGNFIDIQFTSEEQEIIDQIRDCETFDDVLEASQRLYDYCKQELDLQEEEQNSEDEKEEQNSEDEKDSKEEDGNQNSEVFGSSETKSKISESESPNTPQNSEKTEEMISQSKSKEAASQDNQSENSGSSASSSSSNNEIEAKTVENFENNLKRLISNEDFREFVYLELPKLKIDEVIVSNREIHKYITDSFVGPLKTKSNIFEEVDSNFERFKKSAKQEVNYLVKEFECRKAADTYSRAQISRSGTLNMSKLYSYKYNDELFRQITTIPDGKNHGLIFILDWSGSMEPYLMDTYKQLMNLVWFCRRLSIPFEVYAFTQNWNVSHYDFTAGKYVSVEFRPYYKAKTNLIFVNGQFNLLNVLTSKSKNKDLDTQLLNIWRIIHRNKDYGRPTRMQLSGTPLNESIVALHQIIPQFQNQNKIQKVHCIILTDGDGCNLMYHANIRRGYDGITYASYSYTFLRDRNIGTTYRMEPDQTKTMLRHLKDCFPDVSLIGFRVSSNGLGFIQKYFPPQTEEYNKLAESWKKNRSFTIVNGGYDSYFALSSSHLSKESEFDVSEDATNTEIKNAFMRHLKNKKVNKKILGEFIRLIA